MSARSRREAEVAVVRPAQPRTPHHAVAGATERRLPGALEVPIEQVVPDPCQPRQDWQHSGGEERLAELASSIREFGVLQPLLVREEGTIDDGRQRYAIIAGARRRAAAERAGLATLPVVVRGEETSRIRILQLIENLQRQDLSPLDEARAYQELIDVEGLTPPQLAERLHISAQHIRDRLRVLADQVLADAVQRRQISMTAARDIKQLPDEEFMVFRARVLAGERLQTNDVAAVRARLAAEGVIHPRRKIAREQHTTFVSSSQGAAASPAQEGIQEDVAKAPEHTTFVFAGPRADGARPEQASAEALAQQSTPEPAESREGETGVGAEGHDGSPILGPRERRPLSRTLRASADSLAELLDASLRDERRAAVGAAFVELAGSPDVKEWWFLVYERLYERLTGQT
jgi:ParB family transcriptional regulator, chromosome partitioning protein